MKHPHLDGAFPSAFGEFIQGRLWISTDNEIEMFDNIVGSEMKQRCVGKHQCCCVCQTVGEIAMMGM